MLSNDPEYRRAIEKIAALTAPAPAAPIGPRYVPPTDRERGRWLFVRWLVQNGRISG